MIEWTITINDKDGLQRFTQDFHSNLPTLMRKITRGLATRMANDMKKTLIFIIFLVIVLVMQFKILPLVQGISQLGEISAGGSSDLVTSPLGGGNQDLDISQMFFYLLMVQGLFTGITIGKLSEGTIKAGVKHSFILVFLAFIVSASANLFVG